MRRYLTLSLAAGLAALAATLPALASSHYLCDFPAPAKGFYQFYRWYPYEFPLKVHIPAVPASLKVEKTSMYVPLVQKAFAAWASKDSKFRFQFVSSPRDAQIVVHWRDYFEGGEVWGKAMYPFPVAGKDGRIFHTSEVHLPVRAQPGTAIVPGAVLFSEDELLAIATHEAGHALGLPHSRNEDDIMTPGIFRLSANNAWSITSRDVTSLKTLYALPIDKDESPCNKK